MLPAVAGAGAGAVADAVEAVVLPSALGQPPQSFAAKAETERRFALAVEPVVQAVGEQHLQLTAAVAAEERPNLSVRFAPFSVVSHPFEVI